jgi:hypothetical protein
MRGLSVIMIILGLFLLAVALMAPFSAATPSVGSEGDPVRVKIRPTVMNTFQFKPLFGSIHIETDVPDTFDISVTGVPPEWVDCPDSVYVDSATTVNFMINPAETGSYVLTFTVSGAGESVEIEEGLWVGRRQASRSDAGEGDGAVSTGNGLTGGLTGMFAFSDMDRSVLISAGVVMVGVITLFLGLALFREKQGTDIWVE